MPNALARGATTILKDNISWHYPFPAANTTPWQMEGSILALKKAGFSDVTCVQNKTVVTNAFKGEDLNHYVPLFKKYNIPVLYNFKDGDMRGEYRTKPRCRADRFPRRHPRNDTSSEKHRQLPTIKATLHTPRSHENAFGGFSPPSATTRPRDKSHARRPDRDPEEITRSLRHWIWEPPATAGPRTMFR